MFSPRPLLKLSIALFVLVLGLSFISVSTSLIKIPIGGIFNPFDKEGNADSNQAQCLAAFLQAIEDVNEGDKSFYDLKSLGYELVSVVRSAHYPWDATEAAMYMTNTGPYGGSTKTGAFSSSGGVSVVAVVNGAGTEQIKASLVQLGAAHVPQTHIISQDMKPAFQKWYPYKTQLSPVDSFVGLIFHDTICNFFNFRRISVFSTNDEMGVFSFYENTNAGDFTDCHLDLLSHHVLRYDADDSTIQIEIDKAKAAGSTVFILHVYAETAIKILTLGYEALLFGRPGIQIIGNEYVTQNLTLFGGYEEYGNKTLSGLDPKIRSEVMKGYVGVRWTPSYNLRTSSGPGYDFVQTFGANTPTTAPSSSPTSCKTTVDDDGSFYLYHAQDDPTKCSGVDFTQFTSTIGEDIYAHAAYAYDAVFLIAAALTNLITAGSDPLSDHFGDVLQYEMINNVNLDTFANDGVGQTGATGVVLLYAGYGADFNGYAHGDREEGHTYTFWNYNAQMDKLVFVGTWDPSNSVQLCSTLTTGPVSDPTALWSNEPCHDIVYNTVDGNVASDFPPYALVSNTLTSDLTKTNIIKIGGIFSPIDANGNVDNDQAQVLAAFIMAIDEINAAKTILPNSKLIYGIQSATDFYTGINSGQAMANAEFGASLFGSADASVVATVGAMGTTGTQAVNEIFKKRKIPHIQTVAREMVLGFGKFYPYRIATTPVDSFFGGIIHDLICNFFSYTKVSIFATNDDMGTYSNFENVNQEDFCPFTVLSYHTIRYDAPNFQREIALAKASGSQVFILHVYSSTATQLLTEGYHAGLFREGTQIIGNEYVTNASTWQNMDPAIRDTVMKGYLGVRWIPNYNLREPGVGQNFVKNFRKLNATKQADASCSARILDDAGTFLLYQSQSNFSLCTGLDFPASFVADDGSDIYHAAAHAYDAVYAIAHGLQAVIDNGDQYVDGTNLTAQIINNVGFAGATGEVAFYAGYEGFNGFAHGDRELGHTFGIFSYDPSASDVVYIGTWNPVNSTILCSGSLWADTPCKEIIFNTHDNSMPLDAPLPNVYYISFGVTVFCEFIAALTLSAVLFYFFVVVYYRNSKIIKASQPTLLYVMLFGGICGFVRMMAAGLPISDMTCTVQVWFGHYAFAGVFGSLFFKTWRIHRIVNNKSLKRVRISAQDIMIETALFFLCLSVYLAFLISFGNPYVTSLNSTVANQETQLQVCDVNPVGFVLTMVLYAFELVFLFTGARFCYTTKDVPDAVNESKFVSAAIVLILIVCALCLPITYLAFFTPEAKVIVGEAAFFFCILTAILLVLGPKGATLMSGFDIDGIDGKLKKLNDGCFARSHEHGSSAKKVSPTEGDDAASEFSVKQVLERTSRASYELPLATTPQEFKKMSKGQRAQHCREQSRLWSALMMRVNEDSDNTDSSNSSSNNSSAHRRGSFSNNNLESGVEAEDVGTNNNNSNSNTSSSRRRGSFSNTNDTAPKRRGSFSNNKTESGPPAPLADDNNNNNNAYLLSAEKYGINTEPVSGDGVFDSNEATSTHASGTAAVTTLTEP